MYDTPATYEALAIRDVVEQTFLGPRGSLGRFRGPRDHDRFQNSQWDTIANAAGILLETGWWAGDEVGGPQSCIQPFTHLVHSLWAEHA
jgi:hypothetical protein